MLVVPVYNVVLAPDATIWFQTEELKKNAGAKGIAVNEKVILIVAKTKEQGEEPAEDSFYPVGAAGTVTEISSQGYAVIRIQYRVDLESVSINPDRTVKLNIHRRNEIDDLDREVEQEKLKNLLQEMKDFSRGFKWGEAAEYYIEQVDSIGTAVCVLSPWLKISNEERYAILAEDSRARRAEMIEKILYEFLEVGRITNEAVSSQQKEYQQMYRESAIRKQMEHLQKELDEMHPENVTDVQKFEQKIRESGMNETARREAEKVLRRLRQEGKQSAESGAPIMIGRDRNGAQSTGGAQGVDEVLDMDEGQDADAERAQPAYACVSIHGLKEGEIYTLTEEKPPEGFTPLKEPYRFSVTLDENGRAELNTCDEYGKNIAGSEKADLLVVVNDGPAIGTKCLDDETGEHTAKADGAIHLTDTCTVTNLAAGETYTLIARLMDTTKYKTSGNVDDVRPVEGSNGEVTGKVTFTADGGETVIGVPIRADGADLSGKSTVVYEALYQGEVGVSEAERMTAAAEEADPNNEDQQIDFEGAKPGSTPATGNQFPLKALAVAVAAAAVMAEMGRRVYQRDDQGGY